jgi:AraC-like DNA-binding protein
MSWEARDWADRKSIDYELDPTTRLVLDRMANHADKQGNNIFPSLSTLERETGLSERTIRRSIKKLLAVGLLDYGDQSVVSNNPRYRNDQLPKVYRLVFSRDAAGMLDFSSFGRLPQKKRRPWSRKPKPQAPEAPPTPPVDKSPEDRPEDHRRPDSVSRTPGQTPRHSVHQTDKPLNDPLPGPAAAAVPASPEVIDYAAIYELRMASRARLAQQGTHIDTPILPPELTPVMQ